MKYSRLELAVWIKVIERYAVLKKGAELEQMAMDGTIAGRDVEMMNRYIEEKEYLGQLENSV